MNNNFKSKKGDAIGIFSPSTPITAYASKRSKRGVKYLEDKGFSIIEGNLTGKSDFYRSGSIKERAYKTNNWILRCYSYIIRNLC